ncbi:hypothetical protein NGF19_10275 [Streptomyces sp. RY43-2]|uniref:Uncharacterized protein n=1 Tax=Streptomyces macrolidinus TaxID=2952607 RepID=A0ABT0ZBM6_9ACTN|nr:hypothetical protein [Streptomyces macrolidinus]MCN9241173.1 hypothetical protein [Streptomyces macrolidinus]
MAGPHEIDPRAAEDPRNVYPSDDEFYRTDRPPGHVLPEDRPRGGEPRQRLKHRGTWATIALILCIIVVIAAGIALFP